MVSPDIHEDSVRKTRESAFISPVSQPEIASPKTDSGLSSIEKSKSVRPEITPPMNAPILLAPSNQESVAFVVATVDARGKPMLDTVTSMVIKGENDIKRSVLDNWMKNLREIEEYVRQILTSPVYQQLQEIRQKGDQRLGGVSGVQSATSANAAAQKGDVNFLSTLDRLQAREQVPSTAKIPESPAPQDSTRVLVLPMTAALLAGGMGLGVAQMVNSSNPMGGVFEILERLQPIFPQVSIHDLIPVINLMIVGPIYFNSWNEAVSNLKNNERHSYVKMAQNFAKDVIKMVTDPNFVTSTLLTRISGVDQLSPQDQDRLARMLKVVLIGVALSLLYSVEVGKVQNGKFGGIEPEEIRDLLTGKLAVRPDPNKKMTEQEQLTLSLINRAREQLEPLSFEDRTEAANMLLEYVTKHRDFDPMLDPAKVFDETLASSQFNPQDKVNMFKA